MILIPSALPSLMKAGMLVMRPWISGNGTTSRTGITTLPAENWM